MIKWLIDNTCYFLTSELEVDFLYFNMLKGQEEPCFSRSLKHLIVMFLNFFDKDLNEAKIEK